MAKSPKPPRTTRAVNWLLLLLAAGLVAYGVSYFIARYKSLHQPLPTPASIARSTDAPSEAPVDVHHAAYSVAANMPKLISLPSIGAEGFIQQVSVNKANAMATPSNVNYAGWYTKSVKPGDEGLSIINGHVQGYYEPGIFKRLGKLKPGDGFDVQFGDDSMRRFSVVSNTSYSVDDVAAQLFNKRPDIARQLNLITCGGPFDTATHQYTQRVLVVAQEV